MTHGRVVLSNEDGGDGKTVELIALMCARQAGDAA